MRVVERFRDRSSSNFTQLDRNALATQRHAGRPPLDGRRKGGRSVVRDELPGPEGWDDLSPLVVTSPSSQGAAPNAITRRAALSDGAAPPITRAPTAPHPSPITPAGDPAMPRNPQQLAVGLPWPGSGVS